jgi:hypothetical protein
MKLEKFIRILQDFERAYSNAEIRLEFDYCESPEQIFIEIDSPEGKILTIIQGKCGL